MQFKPLVSDSQVLVFKKNTSIFIINIHVDDIILATNDEEMRQKVLKVLRKEFLVKDLGPLTYYLGIKVETADNVTKLSQSAYCEKLIDKFKMATANPSSVPGPPNLQVSKDEYPTSEKEKTEMRAKPFRSLVGSLMYSYIGTRPDIGSVLIKVASMSENPAKKHWKAAKMILRYLKGSKGNALEYRGKLNENGKVDIIVYSDSDWAQDRDDRKSISGFVVKLAGGPISWQSRKQKTRAMSSCEAEFISLTEATKEVLWLTYFLDELGIEYNTPRIFTDSRSAMEWSKNAVHHQRTKHVALKYFFVRDEVRNNRVKIEYISTKDNEADIMTKSTVKSVFQKLAPRVMGRLF